MPTIPNKNTLLTQGCSTTYGKVELQRVTLYFVGGLCALSLVASILAFFVFQNIEAAALFQIPVLSCLNRFLCYLYPNSNANIQSVISVLQTLFQHIIHK